MRRYSWKYFKIFLLVFVISYFITPYLVFISLLFPPLTVLTLHYLITGLLIHLPSSFCDGLDCFIYLNILSAFMLGAFVTAYIVIRDKMSKKTALQIQPIKLTSGYESKAVKVTKNHYWVIGGLIGVAVMFTPLNILFDPVFINIEKYFKLMFSYNQTIDILPIISYFGYFILGSIAGLIFSKIKKPVV